MEVVFAIIKFLDTFLPGALILAAFAAVIIPILVLGAIVIGVKKLFGVKS